VFTLGAISLSGPGVDSGVVVGAHSRFPDTRVGGNFDVPRLEQNATKVYSLGTFGKFWGTFLSLHTEYFFHGARFHALAAISLELRSGVRGESDYAP
jgi:hypothetical protein